MDSAIVIHTPSPNPIAYTPSPSHSSTGYTPRPVHYQNLDNQYQHFPTISNSQNNQPMPNSSVQFSITETAGTYLSNFNLDTNTDNINE